SPSGAFQDVLPGRPFGAGGVSFAARRAVISSWKPADRMTVLLTTRACQACGQARRSGRKNWNHREHREHRGNSNSMNSSLCSLCSLWSIEFLSHETHRHREVECLCGSVVG